MLARKEFNALNLIRAEGVPPDEELARKLGCSLRKAGSLVRRFCATGWLRKDRFGLSYRGMRKLKPYKVDNAIIMAAGMSSRFAPLSYEKPKGVLEVKGEVLIERQIRQLQEAGISDITVVVGYMKEKFLYLREKCGVDIVVNQDYCRFNNTSTLIRVKDRLKNTYVCSSDNYFTENVFEPYVYHAYYAAAYFPGKSDEWGLRANSKGRIVEIRHSPVDMWCMMGHVYFDRRFSVAFRRLLTSEYERDETRQGLWECLFEKHLGELDMEIRKYPEGVVREFDTLNELRAFDKRYVDDTGSAIFRNICNVLHCRESAISGIEVMKQGLTNLSFKFSVGGRAYVYRHLGAGTEGYISRRSEAYSHDLPDRHVGGACAYKHFMQQLPKKGCV